MLPIHLVRGSPVPLILDPTEARIIGCLIEKSVVTPNQYPLTLNALTNACNQKSGRNPVTVLKQGEVQATLRSLENQNLVRSDENFKSRSEKYVHRFCNSRYSDFQFDPPQLAIICLLLLRGPQTPGELRARSGRLHEFADNSDVVTSLNELINREPESLVVKLPRTPGRKDSEYMHLFFGPVDVEAHAARAQAASAEPSKRGSASDLEQRVSQLEAELTALKEKLNIEA